MEKTRSVMARMLVLALTVAAVDSGRSSASEASALQLARALARSVPSPEKTTGGEFEGHEFWEKNQPLFEAARLEYGVRHAALYAFDEHEQIFVEPALRAAVSELHAAGAAADESSLRRLLAPTSVDGVLGFNLFTARFREMLLEELEHLEASGIPLRRPNGMNRFGAILEFLGFAHFLDRLTARYVRPMAQMLFPDLVGPADALEHYGFVVRYKLGEDLELAEHTDASVVTLNVCLGKDFEGGELTFKGTRMVDNRPKEVPPKQLRITPGMAIIHRGGQYHSAKPLVSGERINMIVWLHGAHGVVRVAPHSPEGQTTAATRWQDASGDHRAETMLSPTPSEDTDTRRATRDDGEL